MSEPVHKLSSSSSSGNQEDISALLLLDDGPSLAAASELTKKGQAFVPYVVALETYPRTIRQAADRLGWDLKVISVAPERVRIDFVQLAVAYGCVSRIDFELGFALMHACSAVPERRLFLVRPELSAKIRAPLTRIAAARGKTVALLNPSAEHRAAR